MPERLVVIGAGDLGGEVARRWVEGGGEAIGVTRSTDRHDALRAWGVLPSTADEWSALRASDAVLLCTPGSQNQEQAARDLPDAGVRRLVMASTTGFFAGCSGLVLPTSPPGTTSRAQAAAAAESQVQRRDGSVIVRLGGLYRAGRGPVRALLRRGSPPPGPPNKPLALIHRDDAATALLAALHHPAPAELYIAVTPPLPTRRAFYEHACARHGLSAPSFTAPQGEPPIQYDVSDLRRDLLPTPVHPDWREATDG